MERIFRRYRVPGEGEMGVWLRAQQVGKKCGISYQSARQSMVEMGVKMRRGGKDVGGVCEYYLININRTEGK